MKKMIGLYVGSFNPLHIGHYNIIQKAEQIFDEVIIGIGVNPDKNNERWELPKTITDNYKVLYYQGLMTDFIEELEKEYKVVLIRGMRAEADFIYELTQYRFLQDLKPDIKVVNIICDKEFEHISSSSIRMLSKFEKHEKYLLK